MSEENGHPIIKIENLDFSIGGRKILKGLSCSFAMGQLHGIIGPNGSGKSTFLRNVCRIRQPEQGMIRLKGEDYRKIPRKTLSRWITLVPQQTHVDFSIRVFDFVAMGRHPHLKRLQWLGRDNIRVVDEALRSTNTTRFKNRFINELSGGEGQLVAIARALATEAPIILLDEPTSALDIGHKLEIMDLMTHLKGQGKTILMSIHDLDLAGRYCDTVTMLQNGRIFFSGSTPDAFSKERIKEVFNVYVEETSTEYGVLLLFHK